MIKLILRKDSPEKEFGLSEESSDGFDPFDGGIENPDVFSRFWYESKFNISGWDPS